MSVLSSNTVTYSLGHAAFCILVNFWHVILEPAYRKIKEAQFRANSAYDFELFVELETLGAYNFG